MNKKKGMKLDTEKPRYYAVLRGFARALQRIGDIGDHGGKKYAFDNWLLVEPYRYEDAMMRHLLLHMRGEETDPDSGLPHLDHAAWNILALIEKRELSTLNNSETQ